MTSHVPAAGRTSIEFIESIEGMYRLEPEWRSLWRADPEATPFQSPDWLIPWTLHLWGGGRLQVLAIRRKDRLLAVAPFFLWGFGSEPERLCLSFLGSGVSDYLGMVCAPGDAMEAARSLLRWILARSARWRICDLQELAPASALIRAAREASIEPSACSVCPVLPLRSSMNEQLAAASPQLRRRLRVAENRLRASGELELTIAGPDNHSILLERFYELHTRRWAARGEPGVFSTEALCAFYREVARRFCGEGILRLHCLMHNGECIAAQFNLAAKGRVYAYAAGFDPQWARCSPGFFLLAHSITDAIAGGAREFDFLRRCEAFKYEWGAADTRTLRLLIE